MLKNSLIKKTLKKYQNIEIGQDSVPFYYSVYIDLGGQSSEEVFNQQLKIFLQTTFATFVYNAPSKSVIKKSQKLRAQPIDIVWYNWLQWIKNSTEAERYFFAVDIITPLS